MTKNFEQRVIREGVVDTANYRYVAHIDFSGIVIRRIPIIFLGTTYALGGSDTAWETVKEIREDAE